MRLESAEKVILDNGFDEELTVALEQSEGFEEYLLQGSSAEENMFSASVSISNWESRKNNQ